MSVDADANDGGGEGGGEGEVSVVVAVVAKSGLDIFRMISYLIPLRTSVMVGLGLVWFGLLCCLLASVS